MHLRLAPLLCFAFLLSAPAAAQAPVRIGLSVPISGPDAAFGQGLRQGAEQALADLNRARGTPAKFVLVPADDGGEARQAAAVARKFAADGVRLVVGPFESSAVAAAAPIYADAGSVVVAPGAAYAPLTGRGLWNLFRIGASDAQQGRAAGSYLLTTFSGRPIGIVHDRTTFGRGLAEAVAARLKQGSQREALFEGFDRGSRDIPALVGRLKGAGVEAVYFGGSAPEAATLVRAMREAGLSATLVASDGILDPAFAAVGPAGEGTVMTLPLDPPRLPEIRNARPAVRSPDAEVAAASAYAAVEVLVQAFERARTLDPKTSNPKTSDPEAADPRTGRLPDGRTIAAVLRSGNPFRTLLGPVTFDANGDQTGDIVALRVWRRTPDGRLDYAGNDAAQ